MREAQNFQIEFKVCEEILFNSPNMHWRAMLSRFQTDGRINHARLTGLQKIYLCACWCP